MDYNCHGWIRADACLDEIMMKQRWNNDVDWKSPGSGQAVLYTAVDGIEEGESCYQHCAMFISIHDCLIHEEWIPNGEHEVLELNYIPISEVRTRL